MVALALNVILSVTDARQAVAATTDVRIHNIAFIPQTITVTVGTMVTWTNDDDMVHTVTSGQTNDDGVWKSSPGIPPGGTFSVTFTKPGTYHYYCKPHNYGPAMHATITVLPAPH
jgi:plastocyanin